MAIRYARACAAADRGAWEQALADFRAVLEADPTHRDAQQRLEQASRQQELAQLQAEAYRLHRAKQWEALLKVGERLQAIDPNAADPQGFISVARAELDACTLDLRDRSGLDRTSAVRWRQALDELDHVERLDTGHTETTALLAPVQPDQSTNGAGSVTLRPIATLPRACVHFDMPRP